MEKYADQQLRECTDQELEAIQRELLDERKKVSLEFLVRYAQRIPLKPPENADEAREALEPARITSNYMNECPWTRLMRTHHSGLIAGRIYDNLKSMSESGGKTRYDFSDDLALHRSMCLTGPFIESGRHDTLTPISPKALQRVYDSNRQLLFRQDGVFSLDIRTPINEAEFYIAHELLLNIKYVNLKGSLEIGISDGYKVISVSNGDNVLSEQAGTRLDSILDEEIPAGRNSGGTGLYLVCLLANKLGGFVVAHTQDEDKIRTYTTSNAPEEFKEPKDSLDEFTTCFKVHIPEKLE